MQGEGIRVKPVGGMDSDSDYLDVKNGNYLKGHCIRHVTRDGNSMFSIQNIVGNEQIVNIPQINPSTKQFEIYFDQTSLLTGTETFTVLIYTSNASLLTTFTFNVDSASIATTIANFNTAFSAAMLALSYTATVASGSYTSSTGHYTFSISQMGYGDYNVYVEPPADNKATVNVFVSRESIPVILSGLLRPIAMRALGDDMFVLSTTQDYEPTNLPLSITNATNASPIVVTFSGNHGLTTGTMVRIKNVQGNTAANGVFTITSVASNQISLDNSAGNGAFAASPDFNLQYNLEGVSQVGVLSYDNHQRSWTYYALMTSKKLGLISEYLPVLRTEDNVNRKSLYWVDGYNLMRCFYYRGAYSNQGAYYHPFNNPLGFYRRETVGLETQLLISNINLDVTITEVRQSGGQMPSGNIVYWVTLLNDVGTRTDYVGPVGPVNIYKGAYTNIDSDTEARTCIGDKELEITPKSVVINVSGIPNAFQYIQLHYGICSGNGTFLKTGSLPREVINERTEIQIIHTGTEEETEFNIGEVAVKKPNYGSARHIDILDNRLIPSHITLAKVYDFTEWFLTWKHALKYHEQDIMLQTNQGPLPIHNLKLRVRENMIETNVLNHRGYMLMERYRFYGVCEYYNGSYSDPFFIDDIIIDNNTYPRRTQTLPNLGLKGFDNVVNKQRIPYIEFHGFNTEFLVDGTPVWQIVKRVHIYRCETKNKQVLGSGLIVPCIQGTPTSSLMWPPTYTDMFDTGTAYIGEWPFIYCVNRPNSNNMPLELPYLGYPQGTNSTIANSTTTAKRKYCAFYSMDAMYGGDQWDVLPNDYLLNLGHGYMVLFPITTLPTWNFAIVMMHQDYYTANISSPNPSKIVINGGTWVKEGGTGEINSIPVSKKFMYWNGLPGQSRHKIRPSSHILELDSDLDNYLGGIGIDYGLSNGIYYRELTATAQYGDTATSQCIPTGCSINIEKLTTKTVPDVPGTFVKGIFPVFGGDTLTHTVLLKLNIPETVDTDPALWPEENGMVIYTAQSRINYLMRGKDDSGMYPGNGFTNLSEFLKKDKGDTSFYNKSYNLLDVFNILKMAAYDPNREIRSKEPTMLAYSSKKVAGSQLDGYRYFSPLDFILLDYTDGPIMGQRVANRQLYTWQTRKFLQHYFNSDGVFITQDGAEAVLGTAGVLARRPKDVSVFGCSNQWSIIVGKSAGGNDVLYWINAVYKKCIRFGFDGTVVIADVHFQDFTFRDGIE